MLESALLRNCRGYIAGQWCDADAQRTMPVVNPANDETIATIPAMERVETIRAIEAADSALAFPTPAEKRSCWLAQIAELIIEHRRELGRIISLEHGKPWEEAQGEADYAASFFRYYARCIDMLSPRHLPDRPRGLRWTVHFRPAGVAALVTPWNFPLAMLAKKMSAALAADCSCVVKPSSRTPLTMVAFFALLEKLQFPRGKANLLLGPAEEISQAFCEHPAVRVISFTGSTEVGRQLMADAARHLKRLSLELGGNAPFIVFADSDIHHAVEQLIANKFRGSGQTCVCANRVYVQASIVEEFSKQLAARVATLKVGNGLHPDTDLGPLIDRSAVEKVQRHIDNALAHGAVRITPEGMNSSSAKSGNFFPPTVLRGVTAEMECVHHETFGPVIPILEFENEDQVIDAANSTEYGLAAYVFTQNASRSERMLARLRFGHVGLNTGSGPTAEAPFGGMKSSGFGREGGLEGLHDFVDPQTIASP